MSIGKSGAPPSQSPFPAPWAPLCEPAERQAKLSGPPHIGASTVPDAAALAHELIEAMTATGNYLTAATGILRAASGPQQEKFGEALEKSVTQFARAVAAMRRLQAAIIQDDPPEHNGS